MSESLATVLVPGLLTSPRLYAPQLPQLWTFGPVMIADNTRDDSMCTIAKRILADAPARFALVGLSMGGYISFEIMRQAPDRVVKLALLDTTARLDLPAQSERRRAQIALTKSGRFGELPALLMPSLVHRSRQNDTELTGIVRQMMEDVGPHNFVRQQTAIISRVDSRPTLATIRCPTLVLVGDADTLTPPDRATEMADGISGARLVVVPNSGHLSPLEQPVRVTRALMDWLRR